jgi:hypothetical protein
MWSQKAGALFASTLIASHAEECAPSARNAVVVAQQGDRVRERLRTRLLDLLTIARTEHADRLRTEKGHQTIECFGQFADSAERDGYLRVRGLTRRRKLGRPGILVPVDQQQANGTVTIAAGGQRSEQDRAIPADEEWPASTVEASQHGFACRRDKTPQSPLI